MPSITVHISPATLRRIRARSELTETPVPELIRSALNRAYPQESKNRIVDRRFYVESGTRGRPYRDQDKARARFEDLIRTPEATRPVRLVEVRRLASGDSRETVLFEY